MAEKKQYTEKEKAEIRQRVQKARLALHVKTIRESKGMSQAELAEKIGYETKAGIVAIENGSRLPAKGKDIDIANALNISLDQLWGRSRPELTDKGIAKLTEPEKTALSLFAPMIRAMSKKGRADLISTALLILKAEGAVPAWGQTEYQKKQDMKRQESEQEQSK